MTSWVARQVSSPGWVLTSLVCKVQSIMVPWVSRKLRSPSSLATEGASSKGRSLSASGPASLWGPLGALAWLLPALPPSAPPACNGLASRRCATSSTGGGAAVVGGGNTYAGAGTGAGAGGGKGLGGAGRSTLGGFSRLVIPL